MPETTPAGTARLTEHVQDWRSGLSVEREQRIIKSVALAGRISSNGYRYADAALEKAAPHYERKLVYLDHAPDAARSTRDLAGSIVNPRYEQGRVRGDVKVLDTDAGRTLLALAEEDTPGVGMSHAVLARKSADGKTVESIEQVLSVDVVTSPATTTSFREQQQDAADEPIDALRENIAELKRELAELRALLNEQHAPSSNPRTEAPADLTDEQFLAGLKY